MSFLPARKGRHRQRYQDHLRLVAGCIPYRLQKDVEDSNSSVTSRINVLMISTPNRDDLVFPKGGWENDETVHEAACREALEEAGVKGILDVGLYALRHDEIIDYGYAKKERKEKKGLEASTQWWIVAVKIVMLKLQEDPLGVWEFRSKSRQNCCNMEGGCRGYMFALEVTEELDSWAEQTSYKRQWLSPEEAYKFCRYDWMRDALQVFLSAIEERGSRRAEKLVELPMFPAADSMAEHQMLTSAGCSEKLPTVQHLEESFTNKCIVQG
ncbi:hypothetical protein GOBAR_DD08193 [Gossypium barbadense]|nr:hypothetical protein GOBAR_DD08193 [Gossypium barbadense]